MRKRCLFFLFTLLIISTAELIARAQDGEDRPRRKDLIAESFDPEAFHQTARFLITTGTGFVILAPTCVFPPGEELGPNDRCVVLDAAPAATTNFNLRDIARISLPGNSAKNLILPIGIHNFNYQLHNTTGVPQRSGLFRYVPYITIESEALKDPRAIDPATGSPYDGKLDIFIGGNRTVNKSLAVDERIREQISYSRVGVGGLSKSVFIANFGLPPDIVDRMFREEMTFRLNIQGAARLVSDGFINFNLRLMGN